MNISSYFYSSCQNWKQNKKHSPVYNRVAKKLFGWLRTKKHNFILGLKTFIIISPAEKIPYTEEWLLCWRVSGAIETFFSFGEWEWIHLIDFLLQGDIFYNFQFVFLCIRLLRKGVFFKRKELTHNSQAYEAFLTVRKVYLIFLW